MEKRHLRSAGHFMSGAGQKRRNGSYLTVFSNVAVATIYGIAINLIWNDTTGLHIFFVSVGLQIMLCIILSIIYNSNMWFLSALAILFWGGSILLYINS